MKKATILIVGDELQVIQNCRLILSRAGYDVNSALSLPEAVSRLESRSYHVLIFDLKLAGGELLERMKEAYPTTVVIILHGLASIVASEVLGYGVYEYLTKPVSKEALVFAVDRALIKHDMLQQAYKPVQEDNPDEFHELVGTSSAMKSLYQVLRTIGQSAATVLLIGQEGTGKKLAARTLHQISPRRRQELIELESDPHLRINASRQLLGYTSGFDQNARFTPGLIEEAGTGTVYVDEIANLDHWGQKELIKAISHRRYLPYGDKQERDAVCRFILSTNRNPKVSLEQKDIIEDLYRNLMVYPLYLPSLAERPEDIPYLIMQFLAKSNRRFNKNVEFVDDVLMTRLISSPWQGNISQLERTVSRMVAICNTDRLELEHYLEIMQISRSASWKESTPQNVEDLKRIKKILRQEAVRDLERSFIIEALRHSRGNVTHAAERVKMKRQNFQALMRKYGL